MHLFIYLFVCLFIYLRLRWVFVAVRGLSLAVEGGGYSSLRCIGVSLWWLLLLQSMGSRAHGLQQLRHTGSVVVARGLERRLSSCGAQA